VRFPVLLSETNPFGPRWCDAGLSRNEYWQLMRGLVMLVGFDSRTGITEVLGSGFLVGTAPHLLALTATHVISLWVDRIDPPKRHAFSGLPGDDRDLRARVQKVLNANHLYAVVNTYDGAYHHCHIASISITGSPRVMDVSCLRLVLPEGTQRSEFEPFQIDAEPYSADEPVLVAGFTAGSICERPDETGRIKCRQVLTARVGRYRGLVERPPGFTFPMARLDMQTLPGMSGGPVLAIRYPQGRPLIASSVPRTLVTVIGVTSREGISQPYLLDGSDLNETWACPIEEAFYLKLALSRTENAYFGEAVRDGLVISYGPRAKAARVQPVQGGVGVWLPPKDARC
jgi:trypsin-like peptidase